MCFAARNSLSSYSAFRNGSRVQLTVYVFDFANLDVPLLVPVDTDDGVRALLLRWMRLCEV